MHLGIREENVGVFLDEACVTRGSYVLRHRGFEFAFPPKHD